MKRAGIVVTLVALGLVPAGAGAAEINVNTNADGFLADGKCGLREAVSAANENQKQTGCRRGEGNGRDVIVLRPVTYTLSVPTTVEDNNLNGDLDVTAGGGKLTLRGRGRTETTIFQDENDRVIDLQTQANPLVVEKLALSNGNVVPYAGAEGLGGSARTLGPKLTLRRLNVGSADADGGGAVFGFGPTVIERSAFSSNGAAEYGGTLLLSAKATVRRTSILGSDVGPTATNAFGGAVLVQNDPPQTATIVDSSIQGSEADSTGAFVARGGGIFLDRGSLTLKRSVVSGNSVDAATVGQNEDGGGLAVDVLSTATVVNSTFFNNTAGTPNGLGGQIANMAGTLSIEHSTLDAGQAGSAGDQIFTSGTTNFGRSIISGDNSTDPCSGAPFVSTGFNIGEFDDPSCNYEQNDDPDAFISFSDNLSDNGGPTQTVPLNPNSDAVDFVPKGGCKQITDRRDQRGFVRPNKSGGVEQPCDAGAFEVGAKKP